MLCFSVLSSGSKANCTYVSDGQSSILVDCGLSLRETLKRMGAVAGQVDSVKGILVTHEHSDHIAGIAKLARKLSVPVYATKNTLEIILANLPWDGLVTVAIEQGKPFQIGEMNIEAFSVDHDAIDPVGYKMTVAGSSLVLATDIGRVSKTLKHQIAQAQALVLEFNHDPEMLLECPYPWELKQRIKGNKGHLSNQHAAGVVVEMCAGDNCQLQILVAAHVSEKSNTPDMVIKEFQRAWGDLEAKPHFAVAGVGAPTKLFTVMAEGKEATEVIDEVYSNVVGL